MNRQGEMTFLIANTHLQDNTVFRDRLSPLVYVNQDTIVRKGQLLPKNFLVQKLHTIQISEVGQFLTAHHASVEDIVLEHQSHQ